MTLATFKTLGFSTKLHLHYLHLTRLCGLCHHPPLLNSGNVSGHHLAGSNKTSCWSSFVSFVASFPSVQFCHPCHLSTYSRWLFSLIWTWNSTMLSSPSPASCRLVDHRAFFTDSTKRPPMLFAAFNNTNLLVHGYLDLRILIQSVSVRRVLDSYWILKGQRLFLTFRHWIFFPVTSCVSCMTLWDERCGWSEAQTRRRTSELGASEFFVRSIWTWTQIGAICTAKGVVLSD